MLREPECFRRGCKHFLGVGNDDPDGNEIGEYVKCEAFPDGIPDEIAYGDDPHLSPVPGQGNDIVFEAK